MSYESSTIQVAVTATIQVVDCSVYTYTPIRPHVGAIFAFLTTSGLSVLHYQYAPAFLRTMRCSHIASLGTKKAEVSQSSGSHTLNNPTLVADHSSQPDAPVPYPTTCSGRPGHGPSLHSRSPESYREHGGLSLLARGRKRPSGMRGRHNEPTSH
jgi:hypothetical protein